MKFLVLGLCLVAVVTCSPTRVNFPGNKVGVVCNEDSVSTTGIQELSGFGPDSYYGLLLCVEVTETKAVTACQKPDNSQGQVVYTIDFYSDAKTLLLSKQLQFAITEIKAQKLCRVLRPSMLSTWFANTGAMPATTSVEFKVGMGATLGETGQQFVALMRTTVYSADKVGVVTLDTTRSFTSHVVVCKVPNCYVTAGLLVTNVAHFNTKEKSWPVRVFPSDPWTEKTFSVTSFECVQNRGCPKSVVVSSLDVRELGCTLGCAQKPTDIPQLIGCVAGSKLEEGYAPLVDCAKHDTKEKCEATANAPLCGWIEAPASYASGLGTSACLPPKLTPDPVVVLATLLKYKTLLENSDLPSYVDFLACLAMSDNEDKCKAGVTVPAATGTNSRKIECNFCSPLPVEATNSVKPDITQLCLLSSMKALVCGTLVETVKNVACAVQTPATSSQATSPKETPGTDSAQSMSVALVSCVTSLCILLMSYV